jgi:hypothetical protein
MPLWVSYWIDGALGKHITLRLGAAVRAYHGFKLSNPF